MFFGIGLCGRGYAKDFSTLVIVDGEVFPLPSWQDSTGDDVDSVDFKFQGFAYRPRARDVFSESKVIYLKDASAYPAIVEFIKPAACTIGLHNVEGDGIKILVNGKMYESFFQVQEGLPIKLGFVFTAKGGFADKSGNIICKSRGFLRYTY